MFKKKKKRFARYIENSIRFQDTTIFLYRFTLASWLTYYAGFHVHFNIYIYKFINTPFDWTFSFPYIRDTSRRGIGTHRNIVEVCQFLADKRLNETESSMPVE